MARVQRATAHAGRQGDTCLHTLRTHESDVRLPPPPPPPTPAKCLLTLPLMHCAVKGTAMETPSILGFDTSCLQPPLTTIPSHSPLAILDQVEHAASHARHP